MKLRILTPKQSLNKAYQKVTISRAEFNHFKHNLTALLANIDHKESEENVKNHLKDFLGETYFTCRDIINKMNKIDQMIYNLYGLMEEDKRIVEWNK